MTSRQAELNRKLRQFYQHPVAQVSLEVIFSVTAIIFFAVFAIKPTLVTMSDLVKELNDKRELDSKLQQKIAALSSVQVEYALAEPKLAALEAAIPSSPDFEQAILQIEKLASEQQVAITAVQIKDLPKKSTATDSSGLKRLSKPLTVDVQGDFINIRQLVEDIGTLRRQITVDAIQFTLSDNLGQRTLRAQLSISLHYFGEESRVGVAETDTTLMEDNGQITR